jgi:hypothetical protein
MGGVARGSPIGGWAHIVAGLVLAIGVFVSGSGPAAADEGEGQKAAVQGPNYVHFDPLSFSVIGPDNRIAEEVSIMLVAQMAPGKSEAALDPYTPRLADAYLTALTDLWDQHPIGTPEVTAQEIKDKLLKVTAGVTGPGMVAAILINSIDERMR